jgi:hypothetical protein
MSRLAGELDARCQFEAAAAIRQLIEERDAAIEAVKEWAAAYRSAGLDGTRVHKPGVVDAAVARVNAACDALFKLANSTSQITQD